MIRTFEEFERILDLVFASAPPPKPLHLFSLLKLARAENVSARHLAKRARSTVKRMEALLTAANPVETILGRPVPPLTAERERRMRSSLGQLFIGTLAEKVFEGIYRTIVGSTELELRDDRTGRGDTDYLLFNGRGRPVFRINIKFHGSLFQKANELVGLDSDDCFALATYKIYGALKKQESEHRAYIFLIVSVPGLTGALVGDGLPEDVVHLSAVTHEVLKSGKRAIEDAIVSRIADFPADFGAQSVIEDHSKRIGAARWFVLSARRADALLRQHLFDRVYGLRVRGFINHYRNVELDMHFSLTHDLLPLTEFLGVLRDEGLPGVVSRLERGTF